MFLFVVNCNIWLSYWYWGLSLLSSRYYGVLHCYTPEMVQRVVFNQIWQTLLSLWWYHTFPLSTHVTRALYDLIPTVLGMLVMEDILFYSLHRLCHSIAWLRDHIHHAHHEWRDPVAAAAADAHPMEHLGVNVFPVLWVSTWFQLNYAETLVWMFLATTNSVLSHSYGNKGFHWLHHQQRNVNFGTLGLCDYLGKFQDN